MCCERHLHGVSLLHAASLHDSTQQLGGRSQALSRSLKAKLHTQAAGEPLMLTSFIASDDPQHAQQSVTTAVAGGVLQEQLQGIGLSLVPGSANVVGCAPVSLTALRKHHTPQNTHPLM